MYKSRIIDVETDEGLKPVEFFTSSAFEYLLGWKTSTIGTQIKAGRFPDTPYVSEIHYPREGTQIRLYTQKMIDEIVDLVETDYPPYYRGRDPILIAAYKEEIAIYMKKVKILEQKWQTQDYLKMAPAKMRPIRRKIARKE